MRTRLVKTGNPLTAKADLLVVPTSPTTPLDGPAAALDSALGGAVSQAIADDELGKEPGSAVLMHSTGSLKAPRALVVSVGASEADAWRRAGIAAGRKATSLGAARVVLGAEGASDEQAAEMAEGIWRGSYDDRRFKSAAAKKPGLEAVVVNGAGTRAGLERATALAEAVALARDLGNAPSNHLTPKLLAEQARDMAKQTPRLSAAVLGSSRLDKLGAGALQAVGQGSEESPRLIVLRYEPAKAARPDEVLSIVGKAVTFDTGGISIKPSGGMEEMKMDMAGGAAALAATFLVARLELPVRLLTVVPAAENMPSGTAIKPGDVITALNGRTIEVINTDAEGRLILADALAHAVNQGATRIVDLATLTGAIIVALGDVYAGLFGNDDSWTETVRAAGERSGELLWPMPIHERYNHLIESKVADLANAAAKREAGSVYAAQFLHEFVDERPWCHLDVAGTAMGSSGATGFGVGLLLALAEELAEPA